MKKVFMFLFLVLIFPINISAKTYYSDYNIFSDFDEIKVMPTDTVDVETERRYKWYKEDKVLGDHTLKGENDFNYPYIDINDYMITDYSNWSDDYPLEHVDRNIESRQIYKYQDMKEIRYIEFSNVSGSYGAFRVSELNITAGNSSINYSISCNNCSSNFEHYIKNGIVYENMAYVNNGGKFVIDLNNYYPLDSINIKLYLYDEGTSDKRYNLAMYREKNGNQYAEVLNIHYFTYNGLNEIVPYNININNVIISNPEWYEVKESTGILEQTKTRRVWSTSQYRYKDKLYRYYNIEKDYYNDYSVNSLENYLIKDENNYKDFYRYRTRDKVEIMDKIIIIDYNDKLKDFILFSTLDSIKTESNIDYYKNGKYEVIYKLPFMYVKKEVIVNIEQNTINEYQKIIDELQQEILNLQKTNSNLIKEYQDIQNEMIKLIEDLNSEIVNYQKEIDQLNENILKLEQENDYKDNELSKQTELINVYKKEIIDLTSLIETKKQRINELEKIIVENDLILKNKDVEINNLKKEITNQNEDWNIKVTNLQKEVDKYKEINNLYINKINECQNKLNNSDNIINQLKDEKALKEDNEIKKAGIDFIHVSIVFSLILLYLILTYFIKKHKKSN